jgi:8-oxo-dGTP pyrophosphatase MutT (NUDIX family)
MANKIFVQKIYVNNKPLVLTNSAEHYMGLNAQAHGYLFLTGAFPRNFRMAQTHLEKQRSIGAIIEDISVEALQQELAKTYVSIEAAGGVVSNPDGGVLMIYRRGKWDLPKGKVDDGEAIEDCAEREVMEETGLPQVEIVDKIGETYHVYTQGVADILKTTHWYNMTTKNSFELTPQKEENILEAKWIAEKKLGHYMHQTYDAVKEILKASGKKWA